MPSGFVNCAAHDTAPFRLAGISGAKRGKPECDFPLALSEGRRRALCGGFLLHLLTAHPKLLIAHPKVLTAHPNLLTVHPKPLALKNRPKRRSRQIAPPLSDTDLRNIQIKNTKKLLTLLLDGGIKGEIRFYR